jgi:hypothetical protein
MKPNVTAETKEGEQTRELCVEEGRKGREL